jgi:hypothetical protein
MWGVKRSANVENEFIIGVSSKTSGGTYAGNSPLFALPAKGTYAANIPDKIVLPANFAQRFRFQYRLPTLVAECKVLNVRPVPVAMNNKLIPTLSIAS